MADRILLTGAAGFSDDSVFGIDNFYPFYAPAEKRRNLAAALGQDKFTLVETDCADLESLERAVGGQEFDAVVHLAAKAGVRPSIEHPLAYARATLTGTQAVLELARRRGISRFVFGSSSSVYGNNPRVPFSEEDPVDHPISPYAATKRGGELLCHTYHHLYSMGVIALRFFTVYGPRQRPNLAIRKFATLMLAGDPIPMFGDGTTERDYTWIDDILQGVVAALDRTGSQSGEFRIINLGESRTTELRRLIDLISEALGIEARIERLPPQPGDVARTYADITRARDLLGYRPGTPVEEGIPRFVAWLLARRVAG